MQWSHFTPIKKNFFLLQKFPNIVKLKEFYGEHMYTQYLDSTITILL